ncbi:hypothetical protein HLV37_00750 [Eggerthellaceae bacterium zg-1084]|uniref:hypothetical protein n=1 Tax=Berryella wangjianweii TaxID=2734634 RepID=UPI0015521E6D|nr:hypothetical protein [Berryella wangjianweii]NPD30419.1 hypothetical protein [Berryella wangjianweii]
MKKRVAAGVSCALLASVAVGAWAVGGLQGPTQPHDAASESAGEASAPKATTYKEDNTTEVLVDAKVDADQIVKVVKHGDHWHVFTKDGREIITYTDPSLAASASQLGSTAKVLSGSELAKLDPNTVVRILRHGDHYHVYTADGREYITYTDPSAYYPWAQRGEYQGSHGSGDSTVTAGMSGGASGGTWVAPSAPAAPGTAPAAPGLSFVSVLSVKELASKPIVKILRHGDHWHAYTADGTEYITHEDPSKAFPHLTIGEYEGSHDGHGSNGGSAAPGGSAGPTTEDPNDPKRVVRILRHGDHWHLHHADGTESVTYTDPSALYPHLKIEDYDQQDGEAHPPLQDSERFTYDEVEAALLVPLKDITYGNLTYTTGFDRASQRFVIPHLDHFHYVSIDTIIQFCRDGSPSFGGHTARDVVATLKYLVLHPEARPNDGNGWGSDAGVEAPADPGPGQGDGAAPDQDATPDAPVTATRIVKEDRGWVVYFSDGSWKMQVKDPSSAYPGLAVEEPEPFVTDKPDSQIIKECCAMYGMSEDELEDALFELPYAPLRRMTFNPDGTVLIHGKAYVVKKMDGAKAAADVEGDGDGDGAESEDAAGAEAGRSADDAADAATAPGDEGAAGSGADQNGDVARVVGGGTSAGVRTVGAGADGAAPAGDAATADFAKAPAAAEAAPLGDAASPAVPAGGAAGRAIAENGSVA